MERSQGGYLITLRVALHKLPGTLGRLTTAIGEAGGDIGAVDIVEVRGSQVIRLLSVGCHNDRQGRAVVEAARQVEGVELLEVSDRTFELHRGGKIGLALKFPVQTRDDLSMAYTPGVGRVSQAIADDPERVWELTVKRNSVAVVTDGTAVLGLGNIGPEAAMPVMEGKAMLFKAMAGVDAYPICLRASSVEEIIAATIAISPGFGGINLEDIAAPQCFEVEERLRSELDIPVFHDDQHGTAVVSLAAILNAARLIGTPLSAMRIVLLGAGAAGVACLRLLHHAGAGDLISVDRGGILSRARTDELNPQKRWIVEHTNLENRTGGLEDALLGANVFIGVSGPGLLKPEWVAGMASEAIVLAMANPTPEIMPEEVPDNVRVMATGRSDYPNQINNVLVFPGFFRGLLDSRARTVDDDMKSAAAHGLAELVSDDDLGEEYIIPSPFDSRVVPAVSSAVSRAAAASGYARTPVGADAGLRLPTHGSTPAVAESA